MKTSTPYHVIYSSVSFNEVCLVFLGKGNLGKSHKAPASPPVVHSVSPPVQKPTTPVNGSSASYKGTATQPNKKSAPFFTPSKSGVNTGTSATASSSASSNTFTSKLGQQQPTSAANYSAQYQHGTQRTTTPTKAVTPTFGGSRVTSTPTPPPVPCSPTGTNVGQQPHKGVGYIVPSSTMSMTAQNQSFGISSQLGSVPSSQAHVGKEPGLNRAPGSQNGAQTYIGQHVSISTSSIQNQPLNLAPGSSTSTTVIAPPGTTRPAPSA